MELGPERSATIKYNGEVDVAFDSVRRSNINRQIVKGDRE